MTWLVAAATAMAGVSAAAAGAGWARMRAREERSLALRAVAGAEVGAEAGAAGETFACEGAPARVLAYLRTCARRMGGGCGHGNAESGEDAAVCPGGTFGSRLRSRLDAGMRTGLLHAGMADVPTAACAQAAVRLGAMAAAAGVAMGLAVSPAMALFLGSAAAIAGASAPGWALSREWRVRAEALARELPELLEVLALGVRSGLTFDRAFRLYPDYFDTPFARACAAAADRWSCGLATREEALMDLAAGYDSPLFQRTVSGVLQSLRRGTSLLSDLEQEAAESRKQFRAAKEEAVAKAPVKMMLPIGTLILPAMLLLVLGPVVLELFGGI